MRLRDVEATRDQAYDAIRRKANAAEWGRRAATAIQGGDFDLAINLCNQAKLELNTHA